MKKHFHKLPIAISIVAVFLTLMPLTTMASTYGITDINDLRFLYSSGDTNPVAGETVTLKDGVTSVRSAFPINEGTFEATYLGYEAAYTDQLRNKTTGYMVTYYQTLFQNNTSFKGSKKDIDIQSATYRVHYGQDKSFLSSNLKIYSLLGSDLNDYTGLSGFDGSSNYYVVGFGDGAKDGDYDDLVIAIKAPYKSIENGGNPVPIPGAVWLLGSGLLGLLGVRRRQNPLLTED